jgi:hypothetical protein
VASTWHSRHHEDNPSRVWAFGGKSARIRFRWQWLQVFMSGGFLFWAADSLAEAAHSSRSCTRGKLGSFLGQKGGNLSEAGRCCSLARGSRLDPPPLDVRRFMSRSVPSRVDLGSAGTRRSGSAGPTRRPRCRSVGRRAGPIESASPPTMVTSGDLRSDQGMYRYSPPFTISPGVRCSAVATSLSPSSRCRGPSPDHPAHHRGHGTLALGW